MKVVLSIFLLILSQQVNGLDLSSLLSSLNGNTLSAIANAYLGGNTQVSSALTNLASALLTKNKTEVIEELKTDLSVLNSAKILTGYSYSEDTQILTLGVLNTSALNTSMNGKLSTSMLNIIITKLNESIVAAQVKAVSGGYDLGQIDLNSEQSQVQTNTTLLYNTTYGGLVLNDLAPILFNVSEPTEITVDNSELEMNISDPLVNVSISNPNNLTAEEKINVRDSFILDFSFTEVSDLQQMVRSEYRESQTIEYISE